MENKILEYKIIIQTKKKEEWLLGDILAMLTLETFSFFSPYTIPKDLINVGTYEIICVQFLL